jgi:hypothetical protein
VDLRAGLELAEKRKSLTLPGLEIRPLGRPARSVTIPTELSKLILLLLIILIIIVIILLLESQEERGH